MGENIDVPIPRDSTEGKHILIIEDIYDSGATMNALLNTVKS